MFLQRKLKYDSDVCIIKTEFIIYTLSDFFDDDKELKSKVKLPKKTTKKLEDVKEGSYDDIRVILY